MKIITTGTAMTKNTPVECLNCTDRANCGDCEVSRKLNTKKKS